MTETTKTEQAAKGQLWAWATAKPGSGVTDQSVWDLLGKLDGYRAQRIAEIATKRHGYIVDGKGLQAPGNSLALHLSESAEHSAVRFFVADALAKERDACLSIVAEYLTDEQLKSVSDAFDARSVMAVQLQTSWAVAQTTRSTESATPAAAVDPVGEKVTG